MNNHGIVLPVTLAFVLAFMLLGSSIIYLSTRQSELAENRIASEKAFWLAEAGIQRALWEEKYNQCRGLVSKATKTACTDGCAKCGEKVLISADGSMNGHYDLELSSASTVVTATGFYPNRTPAPNRAQRTVQLASTSQFDYAIFAEEKITIFNNTIIDSYNSELGSYGPDNKASNGDIGSNKGKPLTLGDESITLRSSGAFIHGDVSTGPEGVISVSHKKVEDYISGSITHENSVDLPPVVVPSSLKNHPLEAKAKLVVDDQLTLKNEKYKFSSIEVKSKGKLYIEGHVKIYLTKTNLEAFDALKVTSNSQVIIKENSSLTLYTDGNISVENGSGINNESQDPKKLTIYSTVVSDKVTDGIDVWNSSDFYGAIYAPGAHMNITNHGNIFGAFVGRNFTVSGSPKFHYDESLAGKITDSSVQWREISEHLGL